MNKIVKYREKFARYNTIGRWHVDFQLEYTGQVSKKDIAKHISQKRPHSLIFYIKKISKGYLHGKLQAYDSMELLSHYTSKHV